MMILVPATYIEGDKQDVNHIRVLNHHKEGLTYSTVRIDGFAGTRQVRCVSRPDRERFPHTYLVHLKPQPGARPTYLRCSNLPNIVILRHINTNHRWPTAAEYVSIAALYSTPSVKQMASLRRLVMRKQRNLVRKGYVHSKDHTEGGNATLTDKGAAFLRQASAL